MTTRAYGTSRLANLPAAPPKQRPPPPNLQDAPLSVRFVIWSVTGKDVSGAEGAIRTVQEHVAGDVDRYAVGIVKSLVEGSNLDSPQWLLGDLVAQFGIGGSKAALDLALKAHINPKGGRLSKSVMQTKKAIDAEFPARGKGERYTDEIDARERAWLAVYDWLWPKYQLQEIARFIRRAKIGYLKSSPGTHEPDTIEDRLRMLQRERDRVLSITGEP